MGGGYGMPIVNLVHTSNSRSEIGGQCTDKMLQSRRFCNYDFLFNEGLASRSHGMSLGSVNLFLLKMLETTDTARDS